MLTVDEIITWIKEYDNPLGDMQTFAEGLCDKVLQLNFIVPNDENAIGYAGTLGIVSESDLTDIVGELNITTSLYKTAEYLTQSDNVAYSFINNSAENILNNDNFWDALIEKVGVDNANDLIKGTGWNTDNRSKYSIAGTEILSLNDLVSENFMNFNAKGDVVLIIAENARIDSVLAVTEIPQLMNNSNVESILGVPKSELAKLGSDIEIFEFLKEKSLAIQSDAMIYGSVEIIEGNILL